MFDTLSGKFGDIFGKLTRRGALSAGDIDTAMRDIRVALLEADVALSAVKALIERVRGEATGEKVLRSVTPGQQVVKIVHDTLKDMLGGEIRPLDLRASPPAVVLMVGLQGSGKTTTTAKLAVRLAASERKKVLMASLDVRRPAAREQLKTLGEQANIATVSIVPFEDPVSIVKRALDQGRREGFDAVLLDTAGRLAIDEDLMAELASVRDASKPVETLLVADAMTGQDAVRTAETFDEKIGLTGIVLTRLDGDARGGAALSMRWVTGKPIKFAGTGEKLDALEPFHPDRVAGRILGMGDVVSLVERAAESIDQDDAEKIARRASEGRMDLDDFLTQLRQVTKLGGMQSLLGMLPGIGALKKQMPQNLDDRMLKRQEAILLSMTPGERKRPGVIKASRKQRIAAGSGTSVQDVNKLLKQFEQMNTMMKRLAKQGGKLGKDGVFPPTVPNMPGNFGRGFPR